MPSAALLAVLLASLLGLFASPSPTAAAGGEDECASTPNPIACENQLPGDPPQDWQIRGAGDPSIQGYATSMSVNAGKTVSFKINTDASAYHIEILRLGYYGGDGARVVASNILPTAQLPQVQPECMHEASTGLIDCGNWSVSASWAVPSNAVSGVYLAHLERNDTGGSSEIPFVVRNDSSHSEILLQTSDATWEAYNTYGGNSLYSCTVSCPAGNPSTYKGAYAVSYNRPFNGGFAINGGASYLWYAEYQMIYWLEEQGYNVSYTSEAAVDNKGSLLDNHKVFMSSGHDEYWSAGQRANVEAAREAGVNLAFFSGNELFWKTRWGPSIDGSNTPYRTLTTYKETHFEGPQDPEDPPTWTGAWSDPRGGPSADGGKPANSLTGQQFEVNSGTSDITVPSTYSKLRLWRHTGVESLGAGQSLTLAPGTGTLGYEWDEDVDNGYRPAGEFDLSSTTVSGLQSFTDYGSTVNSNETGTHHLTLYRARSGALVFGAGTVQWSWGLADINAWAVGTTDPSNNPPDPNMEQFTVNLLAEMGAQPGTLQPELQAGEASANRTPPQSTITSPTAGETITDGSQSTITGTATASGGGVVAGVEVSTDNGTTWHPASITSPDGASVSWSYTWAAHGYPSTTIKSRAVDDSANLETPSPGVQVNVSCPCSIWGNAVTPSVIDSGDPHAVTLGVKFTTETFGTISGIRFYKSAANTGTHVGSLWTSSGTLLASATFSSESESGWQQVTFSSPVDVFPNTSYVASYFAPTGHYSANNTYFLTPPATGGHTLDSPPLHATPANAAPAGGAFSSANGFFSYGPTSTFPTSSLNGTNYWVDPVFTPVAAAGAVGNAHAVAGRGSAVVGWNAPSSGGAVTEYKITPYIGTEAQAATILTGTPPATTTVVEGLKNGVAYTFTVQAVNPNGAGPVSENTSPVTPSTVTAPSEPTGVGALAASSQAQVSWNEPASNGGSAISAYRITPYTGTTALTPVEAPAGSASTTVKGLANGTSYTFTVTALNTAGSGPASAPSAAVVPRDTIFDFATPAVAGENDSSSVEVGVKFSSEMAGTITGIRFYKATTNTGTHVGSLWTSTGTLLASATFSNETASGWQQVNFASPITINANTTYVAGYLAPKGHYAATPNGFAGAVTNAPLAALSNTTSTNGVYSYANTTTFPTSSFKATNYWVDVDFQPGAVTAPGRVTGVTATALAGAASVSWSAPAEGGPVAEYKITPYIGAEPQPASTITGTPPATTATVTGLKAGKTYTFTVQAINSKGTGTASEASNPVTPTAGNPPSEPTGVGALAASSQAQVSWNEPASNGGSAISAYRITPYTGTTALTPVEAPAGSASTTVKGLANGTSYTFTVTALNTAGSGPASAPSAAVVPRDTIFDFATPAVAGENDSSSVEVGVKFSSEMAGTITGIRFYKATTNTGTHVGSLWTSTGTLLASATFSNETASGWQQVNFASPITINANTTYVAGYLAPKGHYAATPNGFAGAVTNAPLAALSNTTATNGVYSYANTTTFPTSSFKATNYWVDVDFQPTPTPGQPTHVLATGGPELASVTWSAPAEGGPVAEYKITPYIGAEAQPATIVKGSPPATAATITGLKNGTTYTFTVQAVNVNGAGPASGSSNAVTPAPLKAPSEPLGVRATAATSQALVSWSEPANNGGSAITGYRVIPYAGATALTPVEAPAGAGSATVTGLTDGTTYTFTVTALNAQGASQPSPASNAIVPQNTIFDFSTPGVIDSGDTSSTEVGVKFSSELAGWVTGLRFYKGSLNTGTHVGSLWNSSGELLASATFSNETASGWEHVKLSPRVEIQPFATYVAGYLAPNGHYSTTPLAFSFVSTSNGPLDALASPISSNGVYSHTATSSFPTTASNATNYWVDVDFEPMPLPGRVTGVAASATSGSASVSWNAPAEGGPVGEYEITPFIGSEPQQPVTVKGGPPVTEATIPGLAGGARYTFVVQALNANGGGVYSAPSNAVEPTGSTAPSTPTAVSATAANGQAQVSWGEPASNGGSPITGYRITPFIGSSPQTPVEVEPQQSSAVLKGLSNGTSYTFTVTASNAVGAGPPSLATAAVTPQETIFELGTPAVTDAGSGESTEVGVKFSSELAGSITGVRFYKAPANTGTHVGSLWNSAGELLATASFGNESASGWQQVSFAKPVSIAAGTTYVAGYLAPSGHYSENAFEFASGPFCTPPLCALASPLSSNGVYALSPTSTFPTTAGNSANYWVDVDFAPLPLPGQVTNVSASAEPEAASVAWSAPQTGGAIAEYRLTASSGGEVQASKTVPGTLTHTTLAGIANNHTYTITVQALNANGGGPASSPYELLLPALKPAAPTEVLASPENAAATVSWHAPNNGGSPITGYTVTPYAGSEAQPATTVSGSPPETGVRITGLANGTSYTFAVSATNGVGTGAESARSAAVTPATKPGAPTNVSATAANGAASVTWSAPGSGGSTIVRYTVTPHAGTEALAPTVVNGSPPETGAHVTGLVNGTAYTFTVSATNALGTGPESEASTPVTPRNATPEAPGSVTATAGNAAATVEWSAPGNGGSQIASYTVTPFIGSAAQATTVVTGTPPLTKATVTGLANGTSYTFTVKATNAVGSGPESAASAPVTPATVPSAPVEITAAGATRQALVGWSAPSSTGGSAITGYRITPYAGSNPLTPTEAPAGASSATVKGLTNGTGYTFTVTALNSVGAGTPSSPSAAVVPQDTIFDFGTPSIAAENDPSSVELGVKFSSEAAGSVTGVRFYKAATNTGTHIGSLWTSTGTLLASATFTGETASGWQQVNFSSPVAIAANTTYIAAYLAPKGHYSATLAGLTSSVINAPLSALANSLSPDGVYSYSATTVFPTNAFNATNYFVDVDFEPSPPTPPGQVTGVTASAGPASAAVSWNAPASGGTPTEYVITPYVGSEARKATVLKGTPPATSATVTGLENGTTYTFTVQAFDAAGAGTVSSQSNAVTPASVVAPSAPTGVSAAAATSQAQVSWSEPANNGGSAITAYKITPFIGSSAQAVTEVGAPSTSTIVKGLTNGTSYTFTVSAVNPAGTGAASAASAAVTPQQTIFDFGTPATVDSGDTKSTELGVKFTSEVAGHVTGIRFYKAATNTGTHVASLWTAGGTMLASATFSGETASGWQQVNFSSPVAITANTTYVAAYLAPKGHYSDTSAAFTSVGVTNGPLTALANTVSANGVYSYSATSVFPTSTFKATNYWVDVDLGP